MLKRTVAMRGLVAMLLAAGAQTVLAAGHGGGGGGGGFGGFGGNSGPHISSQGTTNSNGPNSLDRDRGHNRSQDRNSKSGTGSSNAANSNGSNSADRDKGLDRASDRAK